MDDKKNVDELLQELEGAKLSQEMEQQQLKELLTAANQEESRQRRAEKVKNFTLDLDLEDSSPAADIPAEERNVPPLPVSEQVTESVAAEEEKPASAKPKTGNGCLKKLIYAMVIVAISVLVAYFAIIFLIDSVGLNQSDKPIDVEIPSGASTKQIAEILADKGVIEHPFCFRVYSRISGSDGKYQLGTFTLSADMGYTDIVDLLQTSTPRETVDVTIPEGFTVEDIAKLLSKNEVCDERSFYEAVATGSFDYDFVRAIPTAADGSQYAGRIYRLEGYLFPDTYNFYKNSSGESAVAIMLENFNQKLTPALRSQISAGGMTIDEAITFASVIQGEAASKKDMDGVSRVLLNRLAKNSGYPKLQCDSTRDYVQSILPSVSGVTVTSAAYDTYQREGLPVGAINNPGLDAIDAALHPSEDPAIVPCYFFATDYKTGITYYSKTFAQHEATCRRYKIGVYG